MRKLLILLCCFTCLGASKLYAATVTVDSVSSMNVRSAELDVDPALITEMGQLLVPYQLGVAGLAGDTCLGYVRFELPDDMVTASTATLGITPANSKDNVVYAMVVNDDIFQPDPTTYTWETAPGIDYTHTVLSMDYLIVDMTKADWAISYTSTYPAYVEKVKSFPVSFIDDDNDGVITVILVSQYPRNAVTNNVPWLYSPEQNWPAGGGYVPRLVVNYTPALIVVSQGSDHVTWVEKGGASTTDTISIYLTQAPTSTVTIDFNYDTDLLTLDKTSVQFDAGNYNQPQVVTVAAYDDGLAGPTLETLITTTVTSDDAAFASASTRTVLTYIENNYILEADVDAVAVATIKRDNPSTSFPGGNIRPEKIDSPIAAEFAYVQFQLPANFAMAVGATLELTQRIADPNSEVEHIFHVLGVNDNVPQSGIASYTYLDAPAFNMRYVPTVGYEDSFISGQATYIGAVPAAYANAAGTVCKTSFDVSEGFADFLSTDSDGIVTLMLIPNDPGANPIEFAGTSDATYSGPVIKLVYTDVAPPNDETLQADLSGNGTVDSEDLQLMCYNWLNCSIGQYTYTSP